MPQMIQKADGPPTHHTDTRSDATIAPSKLSPERVTKTMVMVRIIAGFTLYGALYMGDIGKDHPKHERSQLLGELGF